MSGMNIKVPYVSSQPRVLHYCPQHFTLCSQSALHAHTIDAGNLQGMLFMMPRVMPLLWAVIKTCSHQLWQCPQVWPGCPGTVSGSAMQLSLGAVALGRSFAPA